MTIPIHVSGRHVLVAAAVERRIEARLAKLARVLPKIMEARVVLSRERYRQVAGITLRAKGRTLHAEASAPDVHAAVDLAMGHLEQQVRRRKERITERKERITERKPRPSRPDPKRARTDGAPAEPVSEAGPALTVRRLPAKPMSVDEALLQLEVGRRSLLIFTNATTRVVNVLRRRPDGSLELVEPAG